ncbi:MULTISPECIES: DUF536 domain-containing protein [unclassified Staphylococcus]|uniref:DUF536 domain-containing protein n=1 Tax=unclassified Staphylococcus TaxID=91994 RepID=UPI00194DEEA1|nr:MULTISPECIES: DUF536 domain-containing protein [unclassified Staphylococcus]
MKSVKTLSEELGVSKQTIFNNIKRLNIETLKQENTSYIKENTDIEKIIQRVNENKKKYGFESTAEDKQKKESDYNNAESKSDAQIVDILKKQIDTLNEQIEKQENRHETTIEFYRKELQERSKLLENQQVLALESNKKIKKLEDQLEEERQLNYSFDKETKDRQNISAQEAYFTEEPKDINQPQKENQVADNSTDYNDISKENKDEDIKKDTTEEEKRAEEEVETNNEVEQPSKKGFWSRLFGN